MTSQSYFSRSFAYCKNEPDFKKKYKLVICQPLNDPQDKINISETLLWLFRKPQNIFQEMICPLLKIKEEFEDAGFCLEQRLFYILFDPQGYHSIF